MIESWPVYRPVVHTRYSRSREVEARRPKTSRSFLAVDMRNPISNNNMASAITSYYYTSTERM